MSDLSEAILVEKNDEKEAQRASLSINDPTNLIRRMTSLERFVSERENFVLNSLIYFEPMKRFENRSDMMIFRCFGDGTCS